MIKPVPTSHGQPLGRVLSLAPNRRLHSIGLRMYEKVTRGIRVSVVPKYLEDQLTPVESYYYWSYTIEIVNEGKEPVQLKTRHWRITDASGRTEEVRGDGVVGKTPRLEPGEAFSYTSGCPLRTSSGLMVGSYAFTRSNGEVFEVAIPAFSLDSPYGKPRLN